MKGQVANTSTTPYLPGALHVPDTFPGSVRRPGLVRESLITGGSLMKITNVDRPQKRKENACATPFITDYWVLGPQNNPSQFCQFMLGSRARQWDARPPWPQQRPAGKLDRKGLLCGPCVHLAEFVETPTLSGSKAAQRGRLTEQSGFQMVVCRLHRGSQPSTTAGRLPVAHRTRQPLRVMIQCFV